MSHVKMMILHFCIPHIFSHVKFNDTYHTISYAEFEFTCEKQTRRFKAI